MFSGFLFLQETSVAIVVKLRLWNYRDDSNLGTPSLREVRAEGWSELSPRCVGAAARRAGLSPLFCDAPISRRPVCFLMHTLPPFGPAELGGFFLEFLRTDSEFGASRPLRERIRGHRGSISLRSFFSRHWASTPPPRPKTFLFLGVAGGTIERSCYSPHYVNTERDYERDCKEINPREKPQGNTSETNPGKPRKKPQKEEGGQANRGDIH